MIALMSRVSRLAGRSGGMTFRSQPLQSKCFSAVQATRADMLVSGVQWQISVSRLAGRGGSSLTPVQLQSRYLSAVHAASAETSEIPALLLQSRCSNCVNAAKGAKLPP